MAVEHPTPVPVMATSLPSILYVSHLHVTSQRDGKPSFQVAVSAVSESGNKPWYLEECSGTLTSAFSSGNNEHDIVRCFVPSVSLHSFLFVLTRLARIYIMDVLAITLGHRPLRPWQLQSTLWC